MALRINRTLRKFRLDEIISSTITENAWREMSNTICNPSSIEMVLSSNHTLVDLSADRDDVPSGLECLLRLNALPSKREVVRQKIIKYHMFPRGCFGDDDETSPETPSVVNVDAFVEMELNVLPTAISWIGRDDIGLSVLYRLCQSLPELFESNLKVGRRGKG